MIEAWSAPFVTRIVVAVSVVLGGPSMAQDTDQSWLDTSNALSTEVLSTIGDYVPEFASRQGLAEYDAKAMMIGAERDAAYLRALEDQATRLRERLDAKVDPNVRKDIGILLDGVEVDIDRIPLEQKLLLDWEDAPRLIFLSLSQLLADGIPADRKAKAIERLERYTGLADGTAPLTEQAMAAFDASLEGDGIGPFAGEVEDAIKNAPLYVGGVAKLFAANDLDAPEALAALEEQAAEFASWAEETVLADARATAQPPAEYYAFLLRQVGVDLAPEELMSRASVSFAETQVAMRMLAPQVIEALDLD